LGGKEGKGNCKRNHLDEEKGREKRADMVRKAKRPSGGGNKNRDKIYWGEDKIKFKDHDESEEERSMSISK